MANDEIRIPNQTAMTKPEPRRRFVIRISELIRHSGFVIRHSE